MKFAVLTGGGDCSGMNAFVRAVVRSSLNIHPETSVIGVLDGWKGLIYNNYRKLDIAPEIIQTHIYNVYHKNKNKNVSFPTFSI